jgi:hypothetical protein
MNPADPLADLRDIHLPPAVSSWPPGPLWWLLLALALVVTALLLRYWLRWWRRNAYRRVALEQLQTIYQQWQSDKDQQRYLHELHVLLKRVALQAFPGSAVAPLNGESWLLFLDQQWRRPPPTGFKDSVAGSSHYQPRPGSADIEQIQTLARNWLRQHRGQPC